MHMGWIGQMNGIKSLNWRSRNLKYIFSSSRFLAVNFSACLPVRLKMTTSCYASRDLSMMWSSPQPIKVSESALMVTYSFDVAAYLLTSLICCLYCTFFNSICDYKIIHLRYAHPCQTNIEAGNSIQIHLNTNHYSLYS